MQRILLAGATVLACLAVLVVTGQTPARVATPPPLPDRVAVADIIVVGTVTAIEDKPVMAKRYPEAEEKTEHKIAVVQITDGLKGAKGLTTIRVGFVPQPVPKPGEPFNTPNGALRVRLNAPLNHTVGQEACFFLSKHAEADFHVPRMYYDVIEKKAPNFAADIALITRSAKLSNDPDAGLNSKDADDRLLTASMLLTPFRPLTGAGKTQEADAAQSKLILNAIASADWTKPSAEDRLLPSQVFQRLNLTAKDGWNPPKFNDLQEAQKARQQWLKDNADKYRVQRYVR